MIILQILLLVVAIAGSPVDTVKQQKAAGIDIPPFVGQLLRVEAPVAGQKVAAGDSLPVVIKVDESVELNSIMVTFSGGMIILDPPFRGQIPIARDRLGIMELSAMGKTISGGMVSSKTVTVEVVVQDADLLRITVSDGNPRLWGPGDIHSLYVYGEYSDGIKREITDCHTSYGIVEGADIVCVLDDGIVVGRSPGAASVSIKHGGLEKVIKLTVGDEKHMNNLPQAVLHDQYEGVVGEELCFSGAGSRDFDECLGEPLSDESFRWKLDFDFTNLEGTGTAFCFTPKETGYGIISLEVSDQHGEVSRTYAMVVIE